MIIVTRQGDATSQKVVSMFTKRVKKSNLVSRKRKTAHWNGKISPLKLKQKAIKKALYLANIASKSKFAKKI